MWIQDLSIYLGSGLVYYIVSIRGEGGRDRARARGGVYLIVFNTLNLNV